MIINKDLQDKISSSFNTLWKEYPGTLEIEALFKNISITRHQFKKCMQYMLSFCSSFKEHDEMLDVTCADMRYTIVGRAKISSFCKTNKIDFDSIIKKKKIIQYDIPDFGVRIKAATEIEMPSDGSYQNYDNMEKTFRLKKRYSVFLDNDTYRVDFTIVKSNISKLFPVFKDETFEIELEYDMKNQSPPKLPTIIDWSEEILKQLRDEVFLTSFSEIGYVQANYVDLVQNHLSHIKGNAMGLLKTRPRKLFVGPQPITLDHVSKIKDNADNYAVTEKADGQRYLLFIDKKNNAYLLNNRMEVKKTNFDLKDNWSDSVLDCEVTELINKDIHILVFDAYFIKSKTVYQKNLIERLKEASAVCKSCITNSIYKEIRTKTFYGLGFGDNEMDIFKGATKILKKSEFAYKTDGLIYTPIKFAVPLGVTWNKVFKWKPPEDNTIDFMVKVQKYSNGTDIINHENMKTLFLYVGSISIGAKEYFENAPKGYNAKLFTPPNGDTFDTFKTQVEVVKNTIRCINNDEIIDGCVVEMSFDMQMKKWIPLRVRLDKTEESQGGKYFTGNSSENANSVWQTIINPITELMIVKPGGDQLPLNANDDKYYVRNGERDKSLTYAMITFHNNYVKNTTLLQKLKGKKSLMDLACGKGGDLQKWINNGFQKVLGVDIFEDNINNGIDGIYQRLQESSKRLPNNARYAFVPMDSSKPFVNIEIPSIKDEYMRMLASCLWGVKTTAAAYPVSIRNLYKMAREKFGVISIQFALHYFFESESKLRGFLQNVSDHIEPGGYFVGTCFDGNEVNKLFGNEQVKSGEKDGKTIWNIKKLYNTYNPKAFGQEIEVYVETINKTHNEYLVNYELLRKCLEDYNIYPLDNNNLFSESKMPFSTLFNRMKSENVDVIRKGDENNPIVRAAQMENSPAEIEFSFLNMAFVFQKRIGRK